MAGCYGTSKEDRARERQLNDYLDSLYEDEKEYEDVPGGDKYDRDGAIAYLRTFAKYQTQPDCCEYTDDEVLQDALIAGDIFEVEESSDDRISDDD